MKKLILLAIVATLFSCNNNSNFKHSKSDTVKTLALYRIGKDAKVELVYRVDKDSLTWVPNSDSTQADKKMQRVSIYFVPIMDSIKGLMFVPYPKEGILIDGHKNVDSIFKATGIHFPQGDTTKRKRLDSAVSKGYTTQGKIK